MQLAYDDLHNLADRCLSAHERIEPPACGIIPGSSVRLVLEPGSIGLVRSCITRSGYRA
jgi:hypothetical protein